MQMRFTWLSLLVLVLFSHCRPDVVSPFEPFGDQTQEIRALLGKAVDTTMVYTFKLERPNDTQIQLTAPNGSFLIISDLQSAFEDLNGNPTDCATCSDLSISVRQALTSSQMVAHGLTLSTGKVAKTLGAVYFMASCNQKPLRLRAGQEVRLVALTPTTITGFDQYEATMNTQNQQIGWTPLSGRKVFEYQNLSGTVRGYDFVLTKTGWTAGFKDVSGPTTNLALAMDPLHNAENTFAYLVVDALKASIRMPFDQQTGKFTISDVPTNLDAQILVVSRVGNDWHAVRYPFRTQTQSLTIDPQKSIESDILQMIKELD